MSTHAQILANRENATHSTGPRTEQGKSRAARNSLKHGLTSSHVSLQGEDRVQYELLHAEARLHLVPAGVLQEALVQQIAFAQWKLARIARWETELIDAALEGREASCMVLFGTKPDQALERLHRYEAQVRRAWLSAARELRIQQNLDFTSEPLYHRRRAVLDDLWQAWNLHLASKDPQPAAQNGETNPIDPDKTPSPPVPIRPNGSPSPRMTHP